GVVPNVATFGAPDTVVGKNFLDTPEKEKTPEAIMTGNNYGDNIVVNSQSDESMKTVVGDNEKDTSVDPDDVMTQCLREDQL
ncbi:hypothetical protein A2U01_0091300, partial [Trifolium medium]|nr:hypothetical protein [Trifolium medium]